MSPLPAPPRPADLIRKLVAHANEGDTAEATIARAKARKAIANLDTELLDTLAGQRKSLVEELRAESQRLYSANERATKQDTGELVSSALVLLQHYERVDALIPAVLLTRIESGHQLTNEERQQLDGPVESFLDQWMRDIRERRQALRKRQRDERRKAKRESVKRARQANEARQRRE